MVRKVVTRGQTMGRRDWGGGQAEAGDRKFSCGGLDTEDLP